MSTSYGMIVDSHTTVTCHTYSTSAPILSIYSGGDGLSVSADAKQAETFARDLLAAAQKFYDATVEHNARLAVTR